MPKVLASRPDGLGTRLLTILYARFFCEKMGGDLCAEWPSLADPNYEGSESLLKSTQIGDIFARNQIFKDQSEFNTTWGEKQDFNGLRTLHISGLLNSSGAVSIEEMEVILKDYDAVFYDVPECALKGSEGECAKSIKENWANFNFSEDVVNAAETIIGDVKLLAHVRRGDIVNILLKAPIEKLSSSGIVQIFQRFLPLKTAANIIRKNYSGEKSLIVCTEDSHVVGRLQSMLPELTIKSTSGYFAPGGNKSALLDLFCLSRAAILIAPYKSYFSECAKLVGNCESDDHGLDIENLVEELIGLIDSLGAENAATRKAVVYATGYQNLWHKPDLPYRAWLLERATENDSELTKRLIS